jgi:predicted glycoside hydrolase/deacetylase ChbG (UPF0249 family)
VHYNPVLKKLGLSYNDRVVIFHADDVGMCQASLAAYTDLVDFGLVSAAATMMPCAWLPATAAFCRKNADKVDMGVHLTLTSEWSDYRWGPLSHCDPASGLVDDMGYFPMTGRAVQEQAALSAIQHEIQTQVERALAAEIDVTHVDSHMHVLFHPRLFDIYVQVALQYRVPPVLLRLDEMSWQKLGTSAEDAAFFARRLQELEDLGIPMMDYLYVMPLSRSDNHLEMAKLMLDTLPAGITFLIFHPAQDTPELRAIALDWHARVADYQTFISADLRAHVQNLGIQVIGYRTLRGLMRTES